MHDKEKETLEVEAKSKIDARLEGLKKYNEVVLLISRGASNQGYQVYKWNHGRSHTWINVKEIIIFSILSYFLSLVQS